MGDAERQDGDHHERIVHFWLPVGVIFALAIAVAVIPLAILWFGNVGSARIYFRCLARLGTCSALAAIFSGVAFAAICYTLHIQQKQHDIQLRELNMKRKIAKVDSQ